MYIFDTDTLSNMIKPTPSLVLMRRLAQIPVDQRYITSISVGELLFGAYSKRPRSEMLFQNIELLLTLPVAILPFDTT
ncbi:MAG: hypothetical protein NTZ05_03710, partial [Chloroflexi bacterium]|nr:hypothetical protein [Chloroflexota bacterium]